MGSGAEPTHSALRIIGSDVSRQLPPRVASPTPGITAMPLLSTSFSQHGPATPAVSSQESISVIVRLKAAPKLSSSTALLSYTVEDGTLATPRMVCRVSSQDNGLASPRLHSCGGGGSAESPAALSTAFTDTDGGANVAAAPSTEATTSPALSVSLPRVVVCPSTQPSKRLPLTPASPTMYSSSPQPSFSAAEAPTTHLHEEDRSAVLGGTATAGRSIGSRGRVLTITSPSTRERRQYEFGEVLEPEVTNTALCERLIPSITEQMAAGFNVCVLCYGQTGSGKTYTMNALAPAVAEEVFRSLDVNNEVVEMSYIQIYNNKAYSLLDGARGGKFGVELSRPLTSCTGSGSNGGGSYLGSALEPKALIQSSAEVLKRMKAASRLRVTRAHTLNAHSSRSFTLLSLHITRFLDGAPLTTTRVTLADLAGTERLKKSGAAGEMVNQAIFINMSLMALRQLMESSGTEAEALHFRNSLLTTYLAPCMHSWHLILLVTVSLEAGSYEETKSSLEFATNARRRKVKKVKSRVENRLLSTVARVYGRPSSLSPADAAGGAGSRSGWNVHEDNADNSERQGAIEVLRYRLRVLEETLKLEQQRNAMKVVQSPLTEVPADSQLAVPASVVDANATALAPAERLQRESQYYRHLLEEREQDLYRLQSHFPSANTKVSSVPSVLSNSPDTSSLSSEEADAGAGDDQPEFATPEASAESSDSSEAQVRASEVDVDDAHAHLLWCVRQLRSHGISEDEWGGDVLDRLRNAVLRATEQYEDVREQLLVLSSSLSGLRTQNHQLYDEVLHANRRLLAIDMERKEERAVLQASTRRAATAETVLEQLRLQLFQTYADQSIREEMTRLYLDAKPVTANVDEAVLGDRQMEQQVELEKVQAHQQVLCDKITELVDNVEQLTRAVAQKDAFLAALESLITPAQRALFHTLSNTATAIAERGTTSVGGSDGGLAGTTTAAIVVDDGRSTADCFSLLQSRVSELSSLLTQEQQQHQFTRCELLEAREDARRSRQEQRQAFFQQQEEARRVDQLMAENYELRQQNERHQFYLDQMCVSFNEKLLQLRHRHDEEMAELRSAAREARLRPDGNDDTVREACDKKGEDQDDAVLSIPVHASAHRGASQEVPSGEYWLSGGTALDSTAVAPSVADLVGSGDAEWRASSQQIQRPGRVQRWSAKSNERRRGKVHEAAAPMIDNAGATAAASVPSRGVRRSSKVARRSASIGKAKQRLFTTYGETANPSDASAPLVKSEVIASAPLNKRRRVRASGAAGAK
uniref:Kinesin, putative n=1 Tax=Leishmania guyanensis TaxID=5670 RepID=A0A1E1ITJ1_LEIGU|nr:kinesin, putative [Leishmania guyanensis]